MKILINFKLGYSRVSITLAFSSWLANYALVKCSKCDLEFEPEPYHPKEVCPYCGHAHFDLIQFLNLAAILLIVVLLLIILSYLFEK